MAKESYRKTSLLLVGNGMGTEELRSFVERPPYSSYLRLAGEVSAQRGANEITRLFRGENVDVACVTATIYTAKKASGLIAALKHEVPHKGIVAVCEQPDKEESEALKRAGISGRADFAGLFLASGANAYIGITDYSPQDLSRGSHQLFSAVEAVKWGGFYSSEPPERFVVPNYLAFNIAAGLRKTKPLLKEAMLLTGLERLTEREREVAIMACQGQRNKTIANKLGISPRTVESHIHKILLKLEVHGKGELLPFFVQPEQLLLSQHQN